MRQNAQEDVGFDPAGIPPQSCNPTELDELLHNEVKVKIRKPHTKTVDDYSQIIRQEVAEQIFQHVGIKFAPSQHLTVQKRQGMSKRELKQHIQQTQLFGHDLLEN